MARTPAATATGSTRTCQKNGRPFGNATACASFPGKSSRTLVPSLTGKQYMTKAFQPGCAQTTAQHKQQLGSTDIYAFTDGIMRLTSLISPSRSPGRFRSR